MTGVPIRIAVRVDFDDGSRHEYEVRGPDAAGEPIGIAWWPEGVVTRDVAKRMEHEKKRVAEIAGLTAENVVLLRNWRADRDKLVALREWAQVNVCDSPRWDQALEIFERDFREAT